MKRNKIVVSAIMILFVIFMSVAGIYQIKTYQNGVLSVYANQQDDYVQLVLDQINIQGDLTEENMVVDILSSLDTSNKKYWTLSKEQALVFVKNVAETNKYKGFTTSTFYVTDSGKEFLNKLKVNRVSHTLVDMDKDRYVASGVIFHYQGAEYKVCLLTDCNVILDDNQLLSSKIVLGMYIAFLLGVLMVAVLWVLLLLQKQKKVNSKLHNKIELQNRMMEKLDGKLQAIRYYNTRWNIFNGDLLNSFVMKLEDKKVRPVCFMRLSFTEEQRKADFLHEAQVLMDERIIRFHMKDGRLVLVFVKYPLTEAKRILSKLQQYQPILEQEIFCGDQTDSLVEACKRIYAAKTEEGGLNTNE